MQQLWKVICKDHLIYYFIRLRSSCHHMKYTLKVNFHWRTQDATVKGLEDTSPPRNSKQQGVSDLGTECGFLSIQFFLFFGGQMSVSLLRRTTWYLAQFMLQIWPPESYTCDFVRAQNSSIIQSQLQLTFSAILQITDLSAGSSGAGLTGIVKSWCRQQWTVPSSYQV